MKLQELILAVKEKNLTKSQIEEYRDAMSYLFAELQIELADIRKEKALFEFNNQNDKATERKRAWGITAEGQREIELSHYSKACEKMLSSLKSRLYSTY